MIGYGDFRPRVDTERDTTVYDDIADEHHDYQQQAREDGYSDMVREYLEQASPEERAAYDEQKQWHARSRRTRTHGGA